MKKAYQIEFDGSSDFVTSAGEVLANTFGNYAPGSVTITPVVLNEIDTTQDTAKAA